MSDWMRKVLESKRATRQRLRELSFSEKLKLLEKLRERTLVIGRSPLRRNQRHEPAPPAKMDSRWRGNDPTT
jgi:hypothetical protein